MKFTTNDNEPATTTTKLHFGNLEASIFEDVNLAFNFVLFRSNLVRNVSGFGKFRRIHTAVDLNNYFVDITVIQTSG